MNWKELAEEINANDATGVIIAQMEFDEIPEEMEITDVPTMLLFVSNNKENPVNYDGDRKPEDWK